MTKIYGDLIVETYLALGGAFHINGVCSQWQKLN